jgi:hypothetical protein
MGLTYNQFAEPSDPNVRLVAWYWHGVTQKEVARGGLTTARHLRGRGAVWELYLSPSGRAGLAKPNGRAPTGACAG